MDFHLEISRVISSYRRFYNHHDNPGVCFEYILIYRCIELNKLTLNSISRFLMKDKSYVLRILNRMVKQGLLKKTCRIYSLTDTGQESYEISKELNHQLKGFLSTREKKDLLDYLEVYESFLV